MLGTNGDANTLDKLQIIVSNRKDTITSYKARDRRFEVPYLKMNFKLVQTPNSKIMSPVLNVVEN